MQESSPLGSEGVTTPPPSVLSSMLNAWEAYYRERAEPEMIALVSTNPEEDVRLCEGCDQPIPAKRLAAISGVRKCVACTEASGDVPRLRRFDEKVGSETVSTYFKNPNAYIALQISRLSSNMVGNTHLDDDREFQHPAPAGAVRTTESRYE